MEKNKKNQQPVIRFQDKLVKLFFFVYKFRNSYLKYLYICIREKKNTRVLIFYIRNNHEYYFVV